MNVDNTYIKWMLLAFAAVAYQADTVSDLELDEVADKVLAAKKNAEISDSGGKTEFSDRELDVFIKIANEVIAGKQHRHGDLPSITGFDIETLSQHWKEVAKVVGREL